MRGGGGAGGGPGTPPTRGTTAGVPKSALGGGVDMGAMGGERHYATWEALRQAEQALARTAQVCGLDVLTFSEFSMHTGLLWCCCLACVPCMCVGGAHGAGARRTCGYPWVWSLFQMGCCLEAWLGLAWPCSSGPCMWKGTLLGIVSRLLCLERVRLAMEGVRSFVCFRLLSIPLHR